MTFCLWRCLAFKHLSSTELVAPPNCGFKAMDNKSHDLALLKLEEDAKFSDGANSPAVGTICLPPGALPEKVTSNSKVVKNCQNFIKNWQTCQSLSKL